ncbi:hypothetical protein AAFC00_006550 [Neodothiora populina]
MATQVSSRPYRSHKFPACERCRKRKIRCNFDLVDQRCVYCRAKNVQCITSPPATGADETIGSRDSTDHRPRKEPRLGEDIPSRRTRSRIEDEISPASNLPVALEDPRSSTRATSRSSPASILHTQSHPTALLRDQTQQASQRADLSEIVGPVNAEDIEVLESYLINEDNPGGSRTRTSNGEPRRPENPVLYLSVPRRRTGLKVALNPGASQYDILYHMLGSFRKELIDLFFTYIHPWFPVLDEYVLTRPDSSENKEIPPALWCSMFASAVRLWNRSQSLRRHPRPEINYVWNLAVEALNEEFFAPSIATISCSTLDMLGRPTLSIIGNIINEGRTVSLAHVLGLNHNPTSWRCSDQIKSFRKRTWWGVFVHSQWSSFAHGVPTRISTDQYDVPLPNISDLVKSDETRDTRITTAKLFVHLCALSQILCETLPVAYSLKPSKEGVERLIRRIECDLDEWEADLPREFRPDSLEKSEGISNLWFCHLCVRLLLARASLRAVSNNKTNTAPENRRYRLTVLRTSAQEVVDYMASLSEDQFSEFWLPYTAHLLATAGMLLLRCAFELTNNASISQSCAAGLQSLQKRLREVRDSQEWDLGDIFLEQCKQPISRLLLLVRNNNQQQQQQQQQQQHSHRGDEESSVTVATAAGGANNNRRKRQKATRRTAALDAIDASQMDQTTFQDSSLLYGDDGDLFDGNFNMMGDDGGSGGGLGNIGAAGIGFGGVAGGGGVIPFDLQIDNPGYPYESLWSMLEYSEGGGG